MSTFELRDYQRECLDAIGRALAGQRRGTGVGRITRGAVVLPTGMGKGHPLDTEVPTPDGLRLWGDLQVGDKVFGSDGAPTTVTGVWDRGVLPTYRVTLKHGESVVVDADHLWRVHDKGRKPRVMSTAEIAAEPLKDVDGYRFAIPVTAPVQRIRTLLPIEPFTVGSLIANGGMTHSGTMLITPDAQVIERIRRHYVANELPGHDCPTYSLPGLTQATRHLGMRVHSRNKRIPRLYLEASVSQRTALLEGLMIGDGSVRNGGRRSLTYSTTSVGLALDMQELVTSLGGTCSIRTYERSHQGKPTEYTLGILLPLDLDPFSTDRKTPDGTPAKRYRPRSAIISIEPTGESVPIRCISVSAPDQLYLITRAHIVTHNTVIFSELAKRWRAGDVLGAGATAGFGRRVLILVHRDELAEQAFAKVHTADQSLRVGIVKAERNDVGADVIIGSVQTLRNPKRLAQLRDVGLVIVDECHHANAASYVTVMEALGCYSDDGTPCIGFTATLVRADKLKPGDVWQEVVYTKDLVWGIRNGHLVDVRGKRVQVKGLDLSKVRKVAGDFQADQLADELLDADAPEQLAQAYLLHAADRLGVVFWPNVAAAEAGQAAFNAAEIPSGLILGTTPKEERELQYKQLAAGDLQTLHNVNVLTEGWDCPAVSCIVPARLTQSAGLYMQMVGRGTRPSPMTRKRDCLVLDPVGVTGRHKLATLADTSMSLHGVDEDETLLEAAQRAEREDAELADELAQQELLERQELERQELHAREVSLFAESASTWLQTSNGTWFIPVQGWLLFLWPEGNGLFSVGSCRLDPRPFQDAKVLASGMLQDGAMAYAQSLAKQHDPKGHQERTAAWRQPRAPQASRVKFARSIGIRVTQQMTDADVADAIYCKLAGQALGGLA